MQITDKDLQQFRERAKTELQSNGAVGRLAWDSVVDALCDEVEELRKNAAISNAVDSAWAGICAACAEGKPPARCAYYGDPNGCNAPTLGKHPEGNLAERLQEELEKAERRIAELERATGNAAAITRAQLQTIADLVAIAHDEYDGCPSYRDDLERFDRLLAEIKSEAQSGTGNAAAIRAALEATLRMTPPLCDVDAARIRAILAVPARNVDRPECRTRDEAWKVFERESAGMWAADWDAAFTAWLFDTKEGSAHA